MTWRDFQRLQRVAVVRDTFISYLDDGGGEPLVLVHGIPTWSYLWSPILGSLTRSARVLAPDLPGFGFSDKRDRFDRSIARQAELIDAWMDRIGVPSATIVGHDIGGGVALRLATLFPSRVRKLCVINTVCYDSWPIELMLQFGHPGADRHLSAAMAVRILKQALKGGFAKRPPDGLVDGLLAPYSTETGKRSLIRNASALNTNLTTEIAPLLPSIRVPTLILWGENDMFQPIAYGERLAWDIVAAPRRPTAQRPGRGAAAGAWRKYGEDLFLWGGRSAIDTAVDAFERAARDTSDGPTAFRLGVAHRARYDSPRRRPGDFRQAVERWEQALALDPNQYIWRRRIQQYGPRLDKPYSFYDWIREARAAIAARGQSPVALAVEPGGAEFARPAKTFEAGGASRSEPDPKGRIRHDRGEFIQIEALTVPISVAPGAATRAHLVMRPNLARKAHWNNEAEDLVVWVNPPAGWQVDARAISVRRPKEVVSQETRRVEFELRSPTGVAAGRVTIPAYALYSVCEDVVGTCLYRRQDVALDVHVRR